MTRRSRYSVEPTQNASSTCPTAAGPAPNAQLGRCSAPNSRQVRNQTRGSVMVARNPVTRTPRVTVSSQKPTPRLPITGSSTIEAVVSE